MKETDVNGLLVHIEYSNPIEINEFACSLNAIGNLFSIFAQQRGESKEMSQSKLYVEKIEEGCIDIILSETIASTMIPFIENMNIILEFAKYLKDSINFFTKGEGSQPNLSIPECKNIHDLLTITASDNNGSMDIGAINKTNKGSVFNNCTFNYIQSNSAQHQLDKVIESQKKQMPNEIIRTRQFMTIYQMRGDMNTDTGNKAVIDSLSKKKVGVLFETDELKTKILYSDENPTKKGYLVDVIELTVNDKLVAYKVMALHDVINLDED